MKKKKRKRKNSTCCCCCEVTSVLSDSVWPQRRQLTRLPHPWDSPGKNTGVGCHVLLQCMKVKSESEVAKSCHPQRPHRLQPTRLLCLWDFPCRSTGVGCHCLLQLPMLLLTNCKSFNPRPVIPAVLRISWVSKRLPGEGTVRNWQKQYYRL